MWSDNEFQIIWLDVSYVATFIFSLLKCLFRKCLFSNDVFLAPARHYCYKISKWLVKRREQSRCTHFGTWNYQICNFILRIKKSIFNSLVFLHFYSASTISVVAAYFTNYWKILKELIFAKNIISIEQMFIEVTTSLTLSPSLIELPKEKRSPLQGSWARRKCSSSRSHFHTTKLGQKIEIVSNLLPFVSVYRTFEYVCNTSVIFVQYVSFLTKHFWKYHKLVNWSIARFLADLLVILQPTEIFSFACNTFPRPRERILRMMERAVSSTLY